ncbi:MAG: dienelactone hydrolase family protein [Phycisphaeraceae bacterium]
MKPIRIVTILVLAFGLASAGLAEQNAPDERAGKVFDARDTFDPPADADPAARATLEELSWEPGPFSVLATPGRGDADATLYFASPRPVGDRRADTVPLHWYAARDEQGGTLDAPAVLVVHSLHPQRVFASALARDLAERDIHAFVIELPGYGMRAEFPPRATGLTLLERAPQAVADVRRARDAIAAMPNVAGEAVALQGTSLGGFVASVAASLDGAFDPVVLTISGAEGVRVIEEGAFDAQILRQSLAAAGYEGEALRELLDPLEPGRLAHRLDPETTWLFSAIDDAVVPRFSSDALAVAIGLAPGHRIWLEGNHYTSLLRLPSVSKRLAALIREEAPAE